MQSCLIFKHMWCAVERDAEFNALEAPQKATTDRKAIALMQVTISSELKHLIRSAADAKAAWKALEDTFKAQSVGRRSVLRQQLKGLSRKNSEDVLSYIARAEILRTELKDACNEELPDDEFVYYIFDELGRAYDAFVRQYRYGNEVLTVADPKNRLLNVEMAVQQQDFMLGDSIK